MADTKITALTAAASASTDDLLLVIDDPAGTPTPKKITVANLITSIQGTTSSTVSAGNHNHTGVYEPADATILKSAAIGSTVQAYDADLAAVAGLSSSGLIARTGAGTAAARTITAGTAISVTNGDGVSGNPTVAVAQASIDHGSIGGLGDDDHTQYSLVAGTRAFTGKVSYNAHPTFSADTEIVDKKYVDDAVTAGGGYTDEMAQDAVGAMVNSSLTYNDATPSLGVTFGTTAGTAAQGNHNHSGVYEPANANIQSHISSTSNPHSTTGDQVLPSQTGNSGKYLTTNGTTCSWGTVSASGGGTKTIAWFGPHDSEPPSSNYATFATRNGRAILQFDTTTQESMVWTGRIPEGASLANGVVVYVEWAAASATTGTIGWDVSFERVVSLDTDSDSWSTAQTITAATVSGTSGVTSKTSVSIAQVDLPASLAAGDMYRVRLRRDVTNDTASGDADFFELVIDLG